LGSSLRIELPDKIAKIFAIPNMRYRVAYGGRGSGKSISFARMMLVEALQKPGKYLCCRELQKSIKTSVHSVLAAEIEALGLQSQFDVGKEYLRTTDGKSEFLFFGLRSNAEEIKSTHGIQRCWVEEAQAVSEFSLDMLKPTVREKGSEIWMTFNPQDELDPVYKMFVASQSKRAAVCEINYMDNPWFPDVLEEERLECLEKERHKYDWIWLGQLYINTEASVYGKWIEKARQEGRMRKGLHDPALPVFTAWDLGYSDDTAIWWFQVAGNEVRLIDYHANHRQDMKYYAEQIYGREIINVVYGENGKIMSYNLGNVIYERRTKYKYANHYAPHDAANKLLQAGGRSVIDQLFEMGIKAFVVPATSQQNQIAGLRATIDISFFDEEHCSEGIRCLKKYEFQEKDDGTYSHAPKHDGWSHGCDAAEIVAQVWKSVKIEAPMERPRFLSEMTVNELFYNNQEPVGIDRI
jgi:phage terminase large subunit